MNDKIAFDVVIVIPLREEFDACINEFAIIENLSVPHQIRLQVTVGESAARVLVVEQRDMGKTEAFRAAQELLKDLDASLLACVGICAGLSKDVNIGDVCYTGVTLDINENIKVSTKDGRETYSLSPRENHSPDTLGIAIRLGHVLPDSKPQYEEWQSHALSNAKDKISGSFTGKLGKTEEIKRPVARQGIIACGMVSASPDYNDAIRRAERRVLALETESSGLFEAARDAAIPVINVRGVSDYAGADKSVFEAETDNQARGIAARNAMTFMRLQLLSKPFLDWLDRRKAELSPAQGALNISVKTPQDLFVEVIASQKVNIDERLRELTPGYETLNSGFRLPLPRLIIQKSDVGSLTPKASPPLEVHQALERNRIINIKIPQEYPEKSLAWAIALDLISSDNNTQQTLPLVFAATDLIPGRRDLQGLLSQNEKVALSQPFCAGVIIIDGFEFQNNNRAKFLSKQIEDNNNLKFVVISRTSTNAIIEASFKNETQAVDGKLSPVPFIALTKFVRMNFQLSIRASEVVAERLSNVFRKFGLTLHPSYFTGISRDALAGLLRANRRADLIELAVTGYLTFAVGEDPERTQLSRRAREQFLSEVAYQIRVEKRRLSEADLIDQATALAEKMDYDIRPSAFVSWFADHGILHFDADSVIFTLPFIESFLLARLLSNKPSEAKRYFDLKADDFDYPCFQIYAELGPDQNIVSEIIKQLETSSSQILSRVTPVLANNKAQPKFLHHLKQINKLEEDLKKARSDVRLDTDKSDEKQNLLDAAEKLQATASERSSETASKFEPDLIVNAAMKAWNLAASLLGSGAERLDAVTKRKLASLLIALTALCMEDWTASASEINYDPLRTELERNEELKRFVAANPSSNQVIADRLVETVMDLAEFFVQSLPFVMLANRLCAEAHDIILAESLSNIEMEGPLEQMVRALWLVSLDAQRGRRSVEASIRGLKNARLARVALSQHFLHRVVWQTPNPVDQDTLLDLADSAIKITNSTVNRDNIKDIPVSTG